jgi:hypothetical protein
MQTNRLSCQSTLTLPFPGLYFLLETDKKQFIAKNYGKWH